MFDASIMFDRGQGHVADGQNGEDHSLNEAKKHFQPQKGKGHYIRDQEEHHDSHNLPGEDVAEKSEAQGEKV
jgi:hypothetical protein